MDIPLGTNGHNLIKTLPPYQIIFRRFNIVIPECANGNDLFFLEGIK